MNIFFILALFVCFINAQAPEVDEEKRDGRPYEIFTLTNSFYGNFIDHEEVTFVKYYTPWCGHCQALQPVYIELAKQMHGKLRFAEINCDENKEICEKEGIEQYPTLNLFRQNRQVKVYGGERNVVAMKNWLEEQILPPISVIEKEDVEILKNKKDKSFILVKSESDDKIRTKLIEVVDALDFLHIYAIDAEIDNFVLYVWNGDSKEMFEYEVKTHEEFDIAKFAYWANIKTFPLFHQINLPLIHRCDNVPVYILWYFYQGGSIPQIHEELFRKLARKYEGKFIFFSFNKVISIDQVKSLHQSGNVFPVISVIHKNKRNIFALPEDLVIDEEHVSEQLDKILSEELKPTFKKSDPIPDDKQKEIFKLTGHNFDEYIVEDNKDILMIFCSEKADVCNYFISTPLVNVQRRMKNIKSFKMAWIDAASDDVGPEFNLDHIPKLYLISNKDGVQTKVEMSIMPSEKNTMEFIHTNAQFKFEMPEELPDDQLEKGFKKEGDNNENKPADPEKEKMKEEIKKQMEKEIDEQIQKKEL